MYDWSQTTRRINHPPIEITYKALDSRFLFQCLHRYNQKSQDGSIDGWSRDLNGGVLATRGYRNSLSIIRSAPRFCPRGRRHSEIGKYIFPAKRSTRYTGCRRDGRERDFSGKLLTTVTSDLSHVHPRFTAFYYGMSRWN